MTEKKTTTRRRTTAKAKAEAEQPEVPEVEESTEVPEAGADDAPEQDTDTEQAEQDDGAAEQDEQAERPDVPACTVTEMPDDLVHVQAVNRADTPAVAALLLQHAEQPGAVRTVTAPEGWLVPATAARSAGVGA